VIDDGRAIGRMYEDKQALASVSIISGWRPKDNSGPAAELCGLHQMACQITERAALGLNSREAILCYIGSERGKSRHAAEGGSTGREIQRG